MRISTKTNRAGFLFPLALLASMAMVPTQVVDAADSLVEGALIFSPTEKPDVQASDATEDTLEACLARIPQNASYGQRLLAEQSCAGEERARQSFQVAPTF